LVYFLVFIQLSMQVNLIRLKL